MIKHLRIKKYLKRINVFLENCALTQILIIFLEVNE